MDKINNIGLARELLKVYDFDGFTPQEVWSRIAQKINIIIEHFNYLDKKFDNQKELIDSKLNYLLNEGLTEQVSKKIIALVNDGTIGELINGTLLKEINDKVDTFQQTFTKQLEHIAIDVKSFGALGDGISYDDDAIMNAYNEAYNKKTSLRIPAGTYRTKNTLKFNKAVNIIMEGIIQQDFGLNIPIIEIGGDSGTVLKSIKANLKARRNPNNNYSYANWEDENNIAIIIKNIQNSAITVDEASYCCVGVKLLGDYAGLSYATINYNNISNNKIGVLFELNGNKEDGAFITELSMYNGRITKNSTLNTTLNNYGVMTRVAQTQHMIDNIKWYDLCLELQKYGTNETNENICFDLQYCKDFKVINFRAEKIRSKFLAYLDRCEGVEFTPGGIYDAPRDIYFKTLSTWDSKTKLTNRIIGWDLEQELINLNLSKNMIYERKVYDSGNINKKILLKPPLLSVNFNYTSSFTSPLSYTYETMDIGREILTNRGLRLFSYNANDTNIGVKVITNGHKYYKLETNSCPPIAILCYDSNSNYLIPNDGNKYADFYYNEIKDFNGNKVLCTKFTTEDDAKKYPQKEIEIIITDERVASFIVLVLGNDKNTSNDYISVFKLKALYINGLNDVYANPTIDCNFDCKPFPSQDTKPVGRGSLGEVIYNSNVTYQADIGWVCTKSGTDTSLATWRSIGVVGDN